MVPAAFILGFALLAGCRSGPQSETIIISGSGELENVQESSPVQVKKIYRLPDDFSNTGEWLGWSSPNSIVGLFKRGLPEGAVLERLTQPYEQSERVTQMNTNSGRLVLSPDGKYVSQTIITHLAATLKILSLEDGTETDIASFKAGETKFLQDVSWSDNGRYISYLVVDASGSETSKIGLYDMDSRTSRYYELKNFEKKNTLLLTKVSGDGRGVLIVSFQSPRKTFVALGRITDDYVEIKYERQTGWEQNTWMSNDQFVFLGIDGTLYEYDQRNGELSVILERVSMYTFSQDRRFIAYSLLDEDMVYVGKMQGRNVLNNGPVYHGMIPTNMYWNGNNTHLLIQGVQAPNTSDENRSFVIEFE